MLRPVLFVVVVTIAVAARAREPPKTAPSPLTALLEQPQLTAPAVMQGLVALHALDLAPRYDPLPVFEAILKQDYKQLPAYSTGF